MSAHSPAPWTAYRMVHEETGEPMTPEQIGEYVCNSVKKSAVESGTTDFLIVKVEKEDGNADVCHVGNGPTSPANARLIAAAPDLLAALKTLLEDLADNWGDGVKDGQYDWLLTADAVDAALTAIGKAEGKL